MVDILVIGEHTRGLLDSTTKELLGAAQRLDGKIGVAILTDEVLDKSAEESIALGADEVFVIQDPMLKRSAVEAHVTALEQLCNHINPNSILLGKTIVGSDLGPRLAFRLDTGMAQDCIGVSQISSSSEIVATRPVYGGNALATIAFAGNGPHVVVIRNGTYAPPGNNADNIGRVTLFKAQLDPAELKVRQLQTVEKPRTGIRLEEARAIVCGGRGLGGPEPFEQLSELATLLRGAVGASRAACDAGWIDHIYQIGLTGKTVAPDLYLAIGVSGASQHMAGCTGSKNIVAINSDAAANIFHEARFGVVGDWRKILTSFIETVRELNEQHN